MRKALVVAALPLALALGACSERTQDAAEVAASAAAEDIKAAASDAAATASDAAEAADKVIDNQKARSEARDDATAIASPTGKPSPQ